MRVYLSVGSNIGDRDANLAFAREQLMASGISILKASTVEETEPVGGPPQPNYLNQVLEVDTDQQPRELLDFVKQVEASAGRKPGGPRWGPRELDIDILLYGHLTIDTADLTIPHPQLVKRDFLLRELTEINPRLTDALSDVTAAQLVRQLGLDDGLGVTSDWSRR
jgi:2-amino-4-hydroxy-6-hydroxymethyldihydropteridine diphosphokinase